ncbi:unnamed protein product [Gadus morhua 'NCC']
MDGPDVRRRRTGSDGWQGGHKEAYDDWWRVGPVEGQPSGPEGQTSGASGFLKKRAGQSSESLSVVQSSESLSVVQSSESLSVVQSSESLSVVQSSESLSVVQSSESLSVVQSSESLSVVQILTQWFRATSPQTTVKKRQETRSWWGDG